MNHLENLKNKEEVTKFLEQHFSRLYIPTMKSRKDVEKYIKMLNEEPSEKDYKNIEEELNKIGEVYYGDIQSQIYWDSLKLKLLMFWEKVEKFFNRFKRKK